MTGTDVAEQDVGRLLYAVENASMRRWPFEHFLAADLLDPDLIDDLRSLDLSGQLHRLREKRGTGISAQRYSWSLLSGDTTTTNPPAIARLRALFGSAVVARVLMRRFVDHLRKRVRTAEGSVDVTKALDLIEDRCGYALPPHVDSARKLITLILYLDDESPGVSLGTSLYIPRYDASERLRQAEIDDSKTSRAPHRRRADFVRVTTVPHRANTALCFAPSLVSYHGVEPVSAVAARRFLLQFQILAASHTDLVDCQ